MNKSKLNLIALSVVLAAANTGCSSTNSLAEKQFQTNETAKINIEQDRINQIPQWFIQPPAADDQGLYGVGVATSKNLQFTLNQARLHAEFELAKQLNQEVTGRERAFMRGGESIMESSGEVVISKFVDSADIVGVESIEKDVNYKNGKYIVHILLRLSFEQQAKIMAAKQQNAVNENARKAYEELEAEAKLRKTAVEPDVSASSSNKEPVATTLVRKLADI